MPRPEEFPPVAQRQLQARQAQIATIAEHSQKKRRGLLERLASVGLGRREDPPVRQPRPEPAVALAAEPTPPAQTRSEPRMQAIPEDNRPQPGNVHPMTPNIDPTLDDDQLEIPAFLRRQAN